MTTELVVIAAVAENNVIGNNGKLPWRIAEDLIRFREMTMGFPIIMGRKTHESIGRALPGRTNIVLSRSLPKQKGIVVVPSFAEAIKYTQNNQRAFFIGGQAVYQGAIHHAHRLEITRVHQSPIGDTYFPEIDQEYWIASKFEKGERCDFVTYVPRTR
jgi:dihydrofolate reductase